MAQEIKLIPLHPDLRSEPVPKSKADKDLDDLQVPEPLNVGSSTTLRKKTDSAVRTHALVEGGDMTVEHESDQAAEDDGPGDYDNFPEGGLQAYLVVIGAFSALSIAFGIMNSIGVIEAYIAENIVPDEPVTSVSWVFSVYFFFAFGGGIYAGPIFDTTGAKIPVYLGSVLIVAGLFATANCTEVWQFVLSFGIVVGAGTSFLMNSCVSAVSHFFLRKRGTALGICSISGSLGGVAWPLMLRSLYPRIGYVWTMRILAFLSMFFVSIGSVLVKHRITKKVEGKKMDVIKNSFVLKELITDKVYGCLAVSILLSEFSLIMPVTYMSSYTIYQGYSESQAFMVVIVCNCVGIPGRYLPNWAADRYGNMNVMVVCSLITCLLVWIIWLPFGHSLKMMYAFSGLFGFFTSSTLSLTPVCCGQVSKVEDFGKRYGTVYFLVAFANLISLPIGGAIIGDGTGYNHMIIFTGLINALSFGFWMVTRYLLVGRDIVRKV